MSEGLAYVQGEMCRAYAWNDIVNVAENRKVYYIHGIRQVKLSYVIYFRDGWNLLVDDRFVNFRKAGEAAQHYFDESLL